jgi:hypothetical protein
MTRAEPPVTLASRRFPPRPSSFRGRGNELRTLAAIVRSQHPTAIALVGGGGSGKTTLAIALAHHLRKDFGSRLVWIRIGAWERTTVLQMMALQLGLTATSNPTRALRRALSAGPTFAVLDNHESDATTAGTLDALRGLPVTWVITARRCLLGGVTLFPVVPALIASQKSPFPAVAALTRLLRWHPVALDLADALVTGGYCSVTELEQSLLARKVDRITPLEHEDDIPEVRAVVHESVRHLPPASRRMLAVLASTRGDHMDGASLASLARARGRSGLDALLRLRLLLQPSPGRYALHATTRHVLAKTFTFPEDAIARHYLALLERHPERLAIEQTHLYALMDWAAEGRGVGAFLRVQALAERLAAGA